MHKATLLAIAIVIGILVIGTVLISTYGDDVHDALLSPEDNQAVGTGETGGNNGGSSSGSGSSGGTGSAGGSSGITMSPEIPDDRHECPAGSQEVEFCEFVDHPVCGWYDPNERECETESCVRSSFPHECDACRTPHIIYWTEGDCPLHG